jgi:hypothetical protein
MKALKYKKKKEEAGGQRDRWRKIRRSSYKLKLN